MEIVVSVLVLAWIGWSIIKGFMWRCTAVELSEQLALYQRLHTNALAKITALKAEAAVLAALPQR